MTARLAPPTKIVSMILNAVECTAPSFPSSFSLMLGIRKNNCTKNWRYGPSALALHKNTHPLSGRGDPEDVSMQSDSQTSSEDDTYESPISPSQNDGGLPETTAVHQPGEHPRDTKIVGNFVAENYAALKRFMTLKDSIDHLGMQITHCTKGNEITIATQIASQKIEMQAICVALNVLYGRLPANQKALDELLAAHLEQIQAEQEKAAAAAATAANSKPTPQGSSQQKRKTPMTTDDEGFITPGRRRTKKAPANTPNPAS
ncbi:hypothetical protein CDAR_39881, partial [Caerostris darwini]